MYFLHDFGEKERQNMGHKCFSRSKVQSGIQYEDWGHYRLLGSTIFHHFENEIGAFVESEFGSEVRTLENLESEVRTSNFPDFVTSLIRTFNCNTCNLFDARSTIYDSL